MAIRDDIKNRLLQGFADTFGKCEGGIFFSAPGRTEICGNHTDHQGGCAIAGAIDAATYALAIPNDSSIIRVKSSGHKMNYVNLSSLDVEWAEKETSTSLVRGVAAAISAMGYKIGGFDAYTVSTVPPGGGLSSSAAYEVLIGGILGHFYNSDAITAEELARAGFVAENKFYGKPCGLLDQSAVAYGGCVYMDFSSGEVKNVSLSPESYGYRLMITNTGTSHGDLSYEYTAIKNEMIAAAKALGGSILGDINESEFYDSIYFLQKKLSQRAILRAHHYFTENRRVKKALSLMENGDFEGFLNIVNESGRSSYMYLQNVYANGGDMSLAIALAESEHMLAGRGACRVHGGGFAGTIQAYVPLDIAEQYTNAMDKLFGEGACKAFEIRENGFEVIE